MTVVMWDRRAILDMWTRWIKHGDFPKSKYRKARLSHVLSRMHAARRRPVPPETPEDYWYEITEERLTDMAKRGDKFEPRPWSPGGRVWRQ